MAIMAKKDRPIDNRTAWRLIETLRDEGRKRLYGRPQEDIDLIVGTLIEYQFGDLKEIPLSVLKIASPPMPPDQDATIYDDKIRRRISTLKDPESRERVERAILDPELSVRKSRNLHYFQVLERLTKCSQEEFEKFVEEYVLRFNDKIIYDLFGIPRPFVFRPREDDHSDYPYFK